MVQTYVRAAREHGSITGTVLHLAVFAYDDPRNVAVRGMGRHVPLCGGRASVERWALTGPWADGWQRHAGWQLCLRCQRALDRLTGVRDAQVVRAASHDHEPADTVEPDTTNTLDGSTT